MNEEATREIEDLEEEPITQRSGPRARAASGDLAPEEQPLDPASDVAAEAMAEAFVESATAGKDPHERREPAGVEDLEPEESAVSAILDEEVIVPDEPPPR
jgi:hypothetical protein